MTVYRYLRRALAVLTIALLTSSPTHAAVIYSSIQNPLPGNVVSLGYQATSTAEFGNRIQFGPGGRMLTNATVTMSNWSLNSQYPMMSPAGWTHPLTLNLYNVNPDGTPGSLIHSSTVTADIPWRPEVFGFNGIAFNVDFELPNVVVPDEIIFGLAYNTQTHGYNPIGVAGPYNSLNFGLLDTATFGPPSVGIDVNPDSLFWNTSFAGFYTDGGAGGVGVFREDTNWTPYTPAIQFQAVIPEPGTLALFGLAFAGGTCFWMRRQKA
jgi:hypothetical protein